MPVNNILKIRKQIYEKNGYFLIKKFMKKKILSNLKPNWINGDLDYLFKNYVPNKLVNINTDHYMYYKPTKIDKNYCINFFKEPICEFLHSAAFNIQTLRNQIEGSPIYNGLAPFSNNQLQYRICKTLSDEVAVYKHADFIEEYRKDPTAPHHFNPNKIQATLFLSDYNKDYTDGGLFFYFKNKPLNIVKKLKVETGDLLFWKYNIPHSVKNIKSLNNTGFLRIIYPIFQWK